MLFNWLIAGLIFYFKPFHFLQNTQKWVIFYKINGLAPCPVSPYQFKKALKRAVNAHQSKKLVYTLNMSEHSHFHRLIIWWKKVPLYQQILGALILGIGTGLILGDSALGLALPGKLVLRLLGALAPPLILTAIIPCTDDRNFGGWSHFSFVALVGY